MRIPGGRVLSALRGELFSLTQHPAKNFQLYAMFVRDGRAGSRGAREDALTRNYIETTSEWPSFALDLPLVQLTRLRSLPAIDAKRA